MRKGVIQSERMRLIRAELSNLSSGNEKYAEFNQRIVNTKKRVLGVRTPDLRKLAKQIAKNMTTDEIQKLANEINKNVHEEILLFGLLINYVKLTDREKLELTKIYLQFVDSWAHIDMFIEKQRQKYDREFWWNYSVETLKSNTEFTVRYGVINLMSNYLDDEYIEKVFAELRQIKHDAYYVKMAVAWLYATAAAKYFDRVMTELSRPEVDAWTRKKTYQKMIESYRMTDKQKAEIRALRDKIKM